MRQLASESPGHLLQPTALVHEAFLRMINQDGVDWRGRSHFLAISAQMMRRILVDDARGRLRVKRGGDRTRILLTDETTISPREDADVLAVDEALTNLAELDPEQARIVELRFFAGMTVDEVAAVLGQSKRTVERKWTAIRAWLRRELSGGDRP
jgi:RNA polymerase sigma factor (TIGR02999 family)